MSRRLTLAQIAAADMKYATTRLKEHNQSCFQCSLAGQGKAAIRCRTGDNLAIWVDLCRQQAQLLAAPDDGYVQDRLF